MDIQQVFSNAIDLLITFDQETYQIIFLSLFVSLSASILSLFFGVPIGIALSSKKFFGKRLVVRVIYMFTSIPPVIMGLFVFILFSRRGVFGFLQWIYTPKVMIIAQMLLVLPIIIGQMYSFSKEQSTQILLVGKTLGANKIQQFTLLLHELRPAIFMSFALGFGRAMSEVGAVMLVGGNIRYKTRVMTTSIATLMGMGEYERAFAFSIVLLSLSFVIQSIVYHVQNGEKEV